MLENKEYVRAWDERVGESTAHLDYNEYLKEVDLKRFYDKVIKEIDFEKKQLLDIGCGGALFFEYLIEKEIVLEAYLGIDISERSIRKAKERISDYGEVWENSSAMLMIDPVRGLELIKENKCNIAICLNVIQHIPDKEYFALFFKMINQSKIKQVVLHYKYNEISLFQSAPYKTTHEINLACYTNRKDIMMFLPNFKIKKETKSGENRFLFLEC